MLNSEQVTESSSKRATISLVMSGFALAISLISVYFQFFFVSYSVKASFLGMEFRENTISMKVAVINGGNRQALITDAYPAIRSSASGGSETHGKREYDFRRVENSKNHSLLPAVMKPGDILLLTFTIPFIPAKYYEEGKSISSHSFEESDKTEREIDVGVIFSVVTHKGESKYKQYAASTIYLSQERGYVGHHYGEVQELVH